MRTSLVVALVAAACGGSAKPKAQTSAYPAAPVTSSVQDALWDLAPPDADLGIVVSARGLTALEHGWRDVQTLIERDPELASLAGPMKNLLTKVWGSDDVTLATAGIAPDRGAALFVGPGKDELLLLPVVDRDKFLMKVKGVRRRHDDVVRDMICKPLDAMYACVEDPRAFARVGKGTLGRLRSFAGARGEIEVIARKHESARKREGMVAVQLSRGTLVLRGAMRDTSLPLAGHVLAAGKPPVDLATSAAFAVLNLGPMFDALALPTPPPLIDDISAATLVRKLAGPILVTLPAGSTSFEMQLPLADIGPARALVERCTEIPALARLKATTKAGRCTVRMPDFALEIEAWIEGNQLRIRRSGTGQAEPVTPTAMASELATGDWAVAAYGRGTIAAEGDRYPIPREIDKTVLAAALRLVSVFNEAGFGMRADGDTLRFYLGVRTLWANPDDVVAKVLAIPTSAFLDRSSVPIAKQIVAAAPDSPFAGDVRAGASGALLPLATGGFLTALLVESMASKDAAASAREAMAKMAGFRDAMCACKDQTCANDVVRQMTEWSQQEVSKPGRQPVMTEADQKEAVQIGTAMGECMQKLFAKP
jgi:hypothetical protein